MNLPLSQTWFHIIKPDHLDMNVTLTVLIIGFRLAVNNIAVINKTKPVFNTLSQTTATVYTKESASH